MEVQGRGFLRKRCVRCIFSLNGAGFPCGVQYIGLQIPSGFFQIEVRLTCFMCVFAYVPIYTHTHTHTHSEQAQSYTPGAVVSPQPRCLALPTLPYLSAGLISPSSRLQTAPTPVPESTQPLQLGWNLSPNLDFLTTKAPVVHLDQLRKDQHSPSMALPRARMQSYTGHDLAWLDEKPRCLSWWRNYEACFAFDRPHVASFES